MRRPQQPLSAALVMLIEAQEIDGGPPVGEWLSHDEPDVDPPKWFGPLTIPEPNWIEEEAERQRQLAAEHDG